MEDNKMIAQWKAERTAIELYINGKRIENLISVKLTSEVLKDNSGIEGQYTVPKYNMKHTWEIELKEG